MSKPRFLVFSDCDGVLTPPLKGFVKPGVSLSQFDDSWFKQYSDRDSWMLERLRDVFVVISTDARNQHWVKHKGLRFVRPDEPSKIEALRAHWRERVEAGDVDGDPSEPVYIYLGDSPQEWECLMKSVRGLVPLDASQLLFRKMEGIDTTHVQCVSREGGCGCLEDAVLRLYDEQLWKEDDRFEHPIWEEIERYLS